VKLGWRKRIILTMMSRYLKSLCFGSSSHCHTQFSAVILHVLLETFAKFEARIGDCRRVERESVQGPVIENIFVSREGNSSVESEISFSPIFIFVSFPSPVSFWDD